MMFEGPLCGGMEVHPARANTLPLLFLGGWRVGFTLRNFAGISGKHFFAMFQKVVGLRKSQWMLGSWKIFLNICFKKKFHKTASSSNFGWVIHFIWHGYLHGILIHLAEVIPKLSMPENFKEVCKLVNSCAGIVLNPSVQSMAGINFSHIQLVWSQKLFQILAWQTEKFCSLADSFKIVEGIFLAPPLKFNQIEELAKDHCTKNIVIIDQILQNFGGDINNF